MLRRFAAWLPAILWGALVFGASSVPGPDLPALPAENADKVVHAATYAVLGALCLWALRRSTRLPGWAAILIGAGLATGYGISDELHQRLTPGRSSDPLDALADALGASLGAAALALLLASQARRRAKANTKAKALAQTKTGQSDGKHR